MSRRDIHYWKCDRPAAFHGTATRLEPDPGMEDALRGALRDHFGARSIVLKPGVGQGNHLTWQAEVDDLSLFLRVENGPEEDDHLAVESALLDRVREIGVPTPRVFGCDATRSRVPFAWQALERLTVPDLNHWQKAGQLEVAKVAFQIGAVVARWQSIEPKGFGILDGELEGYRSSYADYFFLRLKEHLDFLEERRFLDSAERSEIEAVIFEHEELLALDWGCLVHKDLALWNMLGRADEVEAFIDFDDAISGDPTDDLSLLACFHDADFLGHAIDGYRSERVLPQEFRQRFWLHLLRNMIIKSVIRVGSGYFDRDDRFFLIGKGGEGGDLKAMTYRRLRAAVRGLREDLEITAL
ncbi:MAG: aminoglycoside phosphotransferase family protein [Verrucomicrobiae bacterium]|nr:aminoglycoside phosphotransferase family protein [Verrucomicrobiae bacterium]